MPEATLRAFADHGDATRRIGHSTGSETLRRAAQAGLDLAAITARLEREGVRAFCDSYNALLDCIDAKLRRTAPAVSPRS